MVDIGSVVEEKTDEEHNYNYLEDMCEARQDKNYGAEEWAASSHAFLFPQDTVANTLDRLREQVHMWAVKYNLSTKGCGQALQDSYQMVLNYNKSFEPMHYNESRTNKKDVVVEVNKFSELYMTYLNNKISFFENLQTHDEYFDGGKLFNPKPIFFPHDILRNCCRTKLSGLAATPENYSRSNSTRCSMAGLQNITWFYIFSSPGRGVCGTVVAFAKTTFSR